MKKKRRLRSVILISAVSAVACGGRAEDNGGGSEQTRGDGDGDGDEYIGDPVGVPPDGSGGFWVGEPIGDHVGLPLGTGGYSVVGTGGFPGGGGAPGDPPNLGGMGGASEESTGGATVGVPPR